MCIRATANVDDLAAAVLPTGGHRRKRGSRTAAFADIENIRSIQLHFMDPTATTAHVTAPPWFRPTASEMARPCVVQCLLDLSAAAGSTSTATANTRRTSRWRWTLAADCAAEPAVERAADTLPGDMPSKVCCFAALLAATVLHNVGTHW